jgi:hypothetical protein
MKRMLATLAVAALFVGLGAWTRSKAPPDTGSTLASYVR